MVGHVFVVHGNLTDIHCDAVLVPCDVTGDVGAHWGRFRVQGADIATLRNELRNARVSEPRTVSEDGQIHRYVDTGATGTTATREWLTVRVRAGLTALAGDVGRSAAVTSRARPLLAMPMFGTGAGGFDTIRGEALKAVLSEAERVATDRDVDIAIVCWQRSDYVATQQQRDNTFWNWAGAAHLQQTSDLLAEQIKSRRLVLFFGAGVSRAAGLNDFEGLVTTLEKERGMYPPPGAALPDRVSRLKRNRTDDELKGSVLKALTSHRYALAHGLLASMRVREAITTNFDSLFELAAGRPYAGAAGDGTIELDVLPWERTSATRPWLLKAHGDVKRPGPIVFSADEYAEFQTNHGPVASVLQAMFTLSREVLFVGYSLRDANVRKLMTEAVSYHRARGAEHTRLGTVLNLDSAETDERDDLASIGLQLPGDTTAEPARRLEIVLDRVAWSACSDESAWLLDPRYETLLDFSDRPLARMLRDLTVPNTNRWKPLVERLRRFGRPR